MHARPKSPPWEFLPLHADHIPDALLSAASLRHHLLSRICGAGKPGLQASAAMLEAPHVRGNLGHMLRTPAHTALQYLSVDGPPAALVLPQAAGVPHPL